MEKKKFGRLFYYCTLIIAIVLMVVALFVFTSDGSDEQNTKVSIIRYAIAYYSFSTLLGSGLIVNEFCSGKYLINKMKLKIVVVICLTVIGAPIFIFVNNATIACALFFVSLLGLIFVLTPSIKDEQKNI